MPTDTDDTTLEALLAHPAAPTPPWLLVLHRLRCLCQGLATLTLCGAVLWWFWLYTVGMDAQPYVFGGMTCLVAKTPLCQVRDFFVESQGYVAYEPVAFWASLVLLILTQVVRFALSPLLPRRTVAPRHGKGLTLF